MQHGKASDEGKTILADDGRAPSDARAAALAGLEQFAAVSSIFDAAEIVLYVADMQTYELLFFNEHAERLWGPGIGRRCYDVLQVGQAGPCAFCTNDRLIDRGRACPPLVWEFQNTANKRWYLCIDKAIPWSDGRLVRMEVAIDVTERKANEQFRQQYLGLISHDLRTPLASIAASASALKLLLEQRALAEGAQPVDAILRNSRRMAEMIDDLLETTRLESGTLELRESRFDLGELAAITIGQAGAATSHSISLDCDGPAAVVADAARIERVLDNMLANAIRYSSPGTTVTVRIRNSSGEVLVTVADRGIGVPPEDLPKLFQPFYRATQPGAPHGLGLGLYNCRLIVERHGGRVWAQSEPGAGSTFGFALPVHGSGEQPPT